MKVGVGHSDNPDSRAAGAQAATMALAGAGRSDACDMVLLFSTSRHDQAQLREAVASVVGPAPIVGGGAAGVITNEYYGYAGDQIAAACIWLDGVSCELLTDGGLKESEEETGVRLGRRLAELGTNPDSPVMLFYDALDCDDGVRMLMATYLLNGIEKGLGFLPDLTGAGLMGDHLCNPYDQWIGDTIKNHHAMALAFSGDIRIDSVIMHGCRPATGYFTVTKAAGQVVLEIDGVPAIRFIDELIGHAIPPEAYPFFLIFGVNHGERWGEYDEDYYASRLCLAIDPESNGIVMFEPDMVEGTRFQLMFRSLDLDYIKPKIERVFDGLGGREPVFAIYINCAGRCAGYAGLDTEDAVVIQRTVAGRVPVLGLYTGVEIASIGGRPRGLDWTGVFCLFSRSADGSVDVSEKTTAPVWDDTSRADDADEAPHGALKRITEQNAAKILKLDSDSILIRHELEQKRRGFALLAELTVSLRQKAGYEDVFLPVAKRINAALNMQRTVVLVPNERGSFTAQVIQGYSAAERAKFAGRYIKVPPELLDPDGNILVTGADPAERFGELRKLLGLPYFISSPVILKNKTAAVLMTGRVVEAGPFLLRLSISDLETVRAICALLTSVLISQRLVDSEERNRVMVDAMPLCCVFWDENGVPTDCNKEAIELFGAVDRDDFLRRFAEFSPEYQPDGTLSKVSMVSITQRAFVADGARFDWVHMTARGELFPAEVTLIRVPSGGNYTLAGYIRDLRDQEAAEQRRIEAREMAERYAKAKNEFLASVSHEIRTPMNAIQQMARVAGEIELGGERLDMIKQGTRSVKLLTSVIETMLDFSKLDSGLLSLVTGEFAVRELIGDIAGIAGREAGERGIELTSAVGEDVPAIVIGDSERLQQALFNLVVNAVKFTETGGVNIRVSLAGAAENGGVVLAFAVRDTGVGIPDDIKEDILTPMFIGDSSYSRKHGGLGMGLPVSNSLALLMGGKLSFDSVVGEGSEFVLEIPFAVPEERPEETPERKSGLEILSGMRVLAAEDNKINQMIIEELLTSVGIETTLAENGLAALAELESKTFDVILMDIQMPELDGLAAAARIRADIRYDGTPILAMTANSGPEHIAESHAAGMNGHLTKPIDVDELYEALKRIKNAAV